MCHKHVSNSCTCNRLGRLASDVRYIDKVTKEAIYFSLCTVSRKDTSEPVWHCQYIAIQFGIGCIYSLLDWNAGLDYQTDIL